MYEGAIVELARTERELTERISFAPASPVRRIRVVLDQLGSKLDQRPYLLLRSPRIA